MGRGGLVGVEGASVAVCVVELFPAVLIVVVDDVVVDVSVTVLGVVSPVSSVEFAVPVDMVSLVSLEAFTDRNNPQELKLKHEVLVKMMNFVS